MILNLTQYSVEIVHPHFHILNWNSRTEIPLVNTSPWIFLLYNRYWLYVVLPVIIFTKSIWLKVWKYWTKYPGYTPRWNYSQFNTVFCWNSPSTLAPNISYNVKSRTEIPIVNTSLWICLLFRSGLVPYFTCYNIF